MAHSVRYHLSPVRLQAKPIFSISNGVLERVFCQDPLVEETLRNNGVTDDALRETELAILRKAGSTIAGTGGLKKIRCRSRDRGKRGSVRIISADYPHAGRTYMLAAFGKNEKDNLSRGECRALFKLKRDLDAAVEKWVSHDNS